MRALILFAVLILLLIQVEHLVRGAAAGRPDVEVGTMPSPVVETGSD